MELNRDNEILTYLSGCHLIDNRGTRSRRIQHSFARRSRCGWLPNISFTGNCICPLLSSVTVFSKKSVPLVAQQDIHWKVDFLGGTRCRNSLCIFGRFLLLTIYRLGKMLFQELIFLLKDFDKIKKNKNDRAGVKHKLIYCFLLLFK